MCMWIGNPTSTMQNPIKVHTDSAIPILYISWWCSYPTTVIAAVL